MVQGRVRVVSGMWEGERYVDGGWYVGGVRVVIASYPGYVGGERWPGIDRLHMCGCFHYFSVKL